MRALYCTYFDHRYLPRGLAMIRSLRQHVPDASVCVLCLDDKAHDVLAGLAEPGVRPISLKEFESGDAALQRAKSDGRKLIEYYFTCTPSLIRYVAANNPDADVVTYLDADLMFFADPAPIYEEMARHAVLIIPHRFSASQRKFEQYGVYNVGWVSFRKCDAGMSALNWWRERTLEWCQDRVDAVHGRFADQRYLDRFAELFPGVHILKHTGANVAPWNLARHRISLSDGRLAADSDPLLFFHYHGLKRLAPDLFMTADRVYQAPRDNLVRDAIYMPYLRKLMAIEAELKLIMPGEIQAMIRKSTPGQVGWAPRFIRSKLALALARLRGRTIRVRD